MPHSSEKLELARPPCTKETQQMAAERNVITRLTGEKAERNVITRITGEKTERMGERQHCQDL